MFITIAEYRVEGDGDAFDAWIGPLADTQRALPGNVMYRVTRHLTDPTRRQSTEVWETEEAHIAHLTEANHVEIIAMGSEMGMRDVYVHHWSDAEGHIERGRGRTDNRLEDPSERAEMYRLIDEFRAAKGLPPSS